MRVLVIVPPERKDFYDYLGRDAETDYMLLWYEQENAPSQRLKFIKQEYYWSDYSTPVTLLDSIRPNKIIFFEIIDQRQIALLVTANALGLTTFYLEHGAAADKDTALERSKTSLTFYKKRGSYVVNRLLFNPGSVFKTKFFYFSAIRFTTSVDSFLKYMRLPFLMQWTTPNKALRNITFPERVPKFAITFNENNFEEYKLYTDANPKSALYTGVPMFDAYHRSRNAVENGVVYIEHSYLEFNLLGWSAQHHKKIAETLFRFANETHTRLLVKLHPRSDLKRWESYKLQSDFFEVVQHGDFTERYLSAKIILGYSSSLITGLLCARKNIVLLGWHPQPRIFGADFTKTGLCHSSMDVNDIFVKWEDWIAQNLTVKHADLYNNFIKKYNYPFDGCATDRIIQTIHTL